MVVAYKPGEAEIHVDRTLNVWGSGGAHKAYFSHLDQVVKDVFNAPLDEQPLGLCDMGCGNGALLLHMREVIKSDTLRGQHLDSHPLMLVGADFNQEALVATADHFRQKGVKGHFIWETSAIPTASHSTFMSCTACVSGI